MRRAALIGALAAALLAGGGGAYAAVSAPRVSMEVVIVIPKGRTLAIFQQVVWRSSATSGVVATLPHARHLRAIDASLLHQGSSSAVIQSSTGRFALRYSVPWNGHSASVTMATPASVGGLLVLTPRSLVLPPVLNPLMQGSGQGRIPDVPNSPVFKEWGASHIAAGTPVMMVLEQAAPMAPARQLGTYPGVALLFQVSMVLASIGALVVALNRRPCPVLPEPMVRQLAEIRDRYRQGVISGVELKEAVQAALDHPPAGGLDG